jgi:hypothetical protein
MGHRLTGGPERHGVGRREFKSDSKIVQMDSNFGPNFDRSKMCLPLLKKLEIKYGQKELEIGNNFPYRNLSRFEMKFELKIRELL